MKRQKRQLWRETVDFSDPTRLINARNQQAFERYQLAQRLGLLPRNEYDSLRGYTGQAGVNSRLIGTGTHPNYPEITGDPLTETRRQQLPVHQGRTNFEADLISGDNRSLGTQQFANSRVGLETDLNRPASSGDTLELAREIADLKAEVARLRSGLTTADLRNPTVLDRDSLSPEAYGSARNREAELLARLRAETQLDKSNLGASSLGSTHTSSYQDPLLSIGNPNANRMFRF